MPVLIALALAVLASIAAKAGMKAVAKVFGVLAFLTFVSWLAAGNGAAILNWIDNPQVDVPTVDIKR